MEEIQEVLYRKGSYRVYFNMKSDLTNDLRNEAINVLTDKSLSHEEFIRSAGEIIFEKYNSNHIYYELNISSIVELP